MKKSKLTIGAFLFSVAMTACMMMPLPVCGQGGGTDGFFNNIEEVDYRDYTVLSVMIANDSFGAPLGSGVAVMMAAGVAYGVVKRRKTKLARGMGIMITGALMMLTMTQCKKPGIVEVPQDVYIKVAVPSDSKVDVNVVTGAVGFQNGDQLLVANNGCYRGTLIYEDGYFTGTISNPSTDDYLHFYFIGNFKVTNLNAGSTSSITINIINQIQELPVVSYGHSSELYHGSDAYNTVLMNKCALVKFNVTSASASAATVVKMRYNKATINFSLKDADNAFSYGQIYGGNIALPPGSGERWGIVFPQPKLLNYGAGSASAGRYLGHNPVMPAIEADEYHPEGYDIEVVTPYKPSSAKGGLFTVDSDGKQVYFAYGDFVTVRSANTWNMTNRQYNTQATSDGTVPVDHGTVSSIMLSGWGTSGIANGATIYTAEKTSTQNTDYNPYGSLETNLCDGNGVADWGYCNGQGSVYMPLQFRTLTADEWEYIFTQRTDAAEKYSYATVVNVPGLLLLPDVWETPSGCSYEPGVLDNFTTNTYDSSQWSSMENAGAIFLACGGYREGVNIKKVYQMAYFWSSTRCDDNTAYAVRIGIDPGFSPRAAIGRSTGASIRLVCD